MKKRTLATDDLLAILGSGRRDALTLLHDWLHDWVNDADWTSQVPRGPVRGTFTVTLTWEEDDPATLEDPAEKSLAQHGEWRERS